MLSDANVPIRSRAQQRAFSKIKRVKCARVSALELRSQADICFLANNISAVYIQISITSCNCLISVNANDFMPRLNSTRTNIIMSLQSKLFGTHHLGNSKNVLVTVCLKRALTLKQLHDETNGSGRLREL